METRVVINGRLASLWPLERCKLLSSHSGESRWQERMVLKSAWCELEIPELGLEGNDLAKDLK